MENTLNSQGSIQKTQEELVLNELYAYCSTSKAPLIVKLFKIIGILDKLDKIKYPCYFLHMLDEKSAAEICSSSLYSSRLNFHHNLIVESLMHRLIRQSFYYRVNSFYFYVKGWFNRIELNHSVLVFIKILFEVFVFIPFLLSVISYPFSYLMAKTIDYIIKSKVRAKGLNDKDLLETKLRKQLFSIIDNGIDTEEKRARIKDLYIEIIGNRRRIGRPDDKFFGELLENETYQKNWLYILELVATKIDDDLYCEQIVRMLINKTTDCLLELCRRQFHFGSGSRINPGSLKINIDEMMSIHEDANEIVLSSISNTCKIGEVFNEMNFTENHVFYLNLEQEPINESTKLIEYLRKAIRPDGRYKENVSIICHGIKTDEYFWGKIRDRFGLNVFNMCIRGKGSDDTSRIDIDPTNNLLARLNNGLHGNDKLKIYTTASGTYFLFDQVSKSKNGNYEVMYYRNSVLNDNGKRITERVLNLFLPPDYKLENQDEKFVVRKTGQSKYEKIANKIDEINKLFDIYQGKEIECKKLANRYKKDKDAVNEQTMRQKAKEYEQAKNKIFSELEERLNEWQLEFCPNGYPDLPDSELDFRKKLKSDTDSYKKVRECFRKTFKLSVNDINKNIFDDMLATILYRYIATIHQASDIYPDAAKRNTFMNALRKQFGGECSNGKLDSYALGTITERSVKYFKYLDEVDKIKNGISDEEKYKLPGKFFEYNENDEDCMYTALNYIQVLIQAAIIIMNLDTANAEIRARFNCNANKLVQMFESEEEEANKYYQDLKKKIEDSVLSNPEAKRPEIFVKSLLENVTDYNESQVQAICDMAQRITDFDLDNPTRKHVTQINCVRAKKDEQGNLVGCKFDTEGVLSVEVSPDFQPPDLQEEPREAQDNNHIHNAIENLFRDLFESLREARAVLNEPIPEPIPRIAGNMHNHMHNDD